MDGIILTPLKKISHPKGDLFHAMKLSDAGYDGFGEAYFSTISNGQVKGWKQHTIMTLNLVVIVGDVEVVVHDQKDFYSVVLSLANYQRLTVSPGLWVAFKGLSSNNILLNLASIEHDPNESNNISLNGFVYDWEKDKRIVGYDKL